MAAAVTQASMEKRRQLVLNPARDQGTLTSADRLTIWDETKVSVSIRQRDSGPARGKRVLTCTATLDVDDATVDLALGMAPSLRKVPERSAPDSWSCLY